MFGGLVVWWFGCLVIWLFGYLVVWWFSYLVVWWFSCLVLACGRSTFGRFACKEASLRAERFGGVNVRSIVADCPCKGLILQDRGLPLLDSV